MKENTRKTFKIFWQQTSQHKLSGLVSLIGVVGGSALTVVTPLYFKKFFDLLVQSQPRDVLVTQIISVLFIIAIIEIIGWAFWRLATFYISYFQASIMTSLSDLCFRYLHRHSFAFIIFYSWP